jgi:GMP synthase-like glutamine amidotransferase
MLRIHHVQHVPFEGLSSMEPVFHEKGHALTATHVYQAEPWPCVSDIDWLIIMGGPMGVHDEARYPWLRHEKRFIEETIESGKKVLGICLGAQLLAHVLGAKVYGNQRREIGWFKIHRSPGAENTILADAIPQETEAFHWHGDTFELPLGAERVASSEACENQGFILDDRVVGFQFHLETTMDSARALIENCRDELDGSQYVQTEDEMLSDAHRFTKMNRIMFAVLDTLAAQHG